VKSKTNFIIVLIGLFTVFFCQENFGQNAREDNSAPFAVVELFTSEGCSSCPPADAFLRQLTKEARQKNQRIFTLSFHVDYWDHLGWKDPFSNNQYTQRQRIYANIRKGRSVYTPQMIINGVRAFGGYQTDLAQKHIAQALNQPSISHISLTNLTHSASEIEITYDIKTLSGGEVLNLALVERNLANKIRSGENSGRTLRHANVVRAFKSITLKSPQGIASLKKSKNLNLGSASVIGYIQDPQNMQISGAAIIDFSE